MIYTVIKFNGHNQHSARWIRPNCTQRAHTTDCDCERRKKRRTWRPDLICLRQKLIFSSSLHIYCRRHACHDEIPAIRFHNYWQLTASPSPHTHTHTEWYNTVNREKKREIGQTLYNSSELVSDFSIKIPKRPAMMQLVNGCGFELVGNLEKWLTEGKSSLGFLRLSQGAAVRTNCLNLTAWICFVFATLSSRFDRSGEKRWEKRWKEGQEVDAKRMWPSHIFSEKY